MFAFIGNIGPWEFIFILLIALIVVGPGKLPEVAKALGKATREFRKATSGIKREFHEVMKIEDDLKAPSPPKAIEAKEDNADEDKTKDGLNK
ncbi:MAG: Sec-independent protein translocase subunit TatA/TatB [Syntrophomonadaceae bacterium]|jgi:TatA/E family protein of Tat protein translocase